MGVQMNIKNAEAVELAAELARAEGMSQTELVLEALRAWKRQRESESVYKKALEICRDAAPRLAVACQIAGIESRPWPAIKKKPPIITALR